MAFLSLHMLWAPLSIQLQVSEVLFDMCLWHLIDIQVCRNLAVLISVASTPLRCEYLYVHIVNEIRTSMHTTTITVVLSIQSL